MLLTAERVAELRRAQRLDAHDPAIAEAHAHARRLAELSDRLEAGDPSALGVSGMRPTHGLMAFLADSECVHGRLPTDCTAACGCFPSELPTPVPITVLSIEEARLMAAVSAPYGRKRDGTPKRRPGRAPRKPTVTPQEASSMITFEKLVEQTEAELARVARECDIAQGVVTAATAKFEALQEQQTKLASALAQLRDAAKVEVPA